MSVLSGTPVLVTGADGFIGSHLTERLVELGADVHVFVRASSTKNLVNISHLADEISMHRGDLRSYPSVRRTVCDLQSLGDLTIFHLAAQAHVGESWERPVETLETNAVGTANLLEAVVNSAVSVNKFITAGTSEEYGGSSAGSVPKRQVNDDGQIVLSERSPVNPQSIYATSKVTADFLTMNYHDAYGLPAITARMFNNYGPRQDPRYVTGTIISQALERDVVELGDLRPKRDMCFVEDGVEGYVHVARDGTPGERYVFGRGENVTMRRWTELILRIGREEGYWESPEIVQDEERFRPGDSEVDELLVDHSKITEETDWRPKVSWEDGIRETISWYAENRSRWRNRADWN